MAQQIYVSRTELPAILKNLQVFTMVFMRIAVYFRWEMSQSLAFIARELICVQQRSKS
jgi:hypothetical protein